VENISFKQGSGDTSLTALTLSANLKSGGLTFIPEFRLDNNADKAIFVDSASLPATSAQVSLAVVYGFNIFYETLFNLLMIFLLNK
jgi:hypothetical protein